MKKIQFKTNVFGVDGFGNPLVVYAAGSVHDVDRTTMRHVAFGEAEEIDAADEPEGTRNAEPESIAEASRSSAEAAEDAAAKASQSTSKKR